VSAMATLTLYIVLRDLWQRQGTGRATVSLCSNRDIGGDVITGAI